jgi:hypothetical protein
VFKMNVEAPGGGRIHAIALQVQIRIEPARRSHDAGEQRGLTELFGEPSRWSRTQKSLLWTEVSRIVPAFEGECAVDLAVPCTYDLDLASTKYIHALRSGSVPLVFLFRGTVFTEGERGLVVSMLPWDREASFELPASTWRAAMDELFPDQGWLRLRRDVLDELLALKAERALTSWDAVIESLLRRDGRRTRGDRPEKVTP